ncbi:MAG TPA: uroporphyrinogen-III C-methyltransferase [Acidimicrobiales bacterium]|jgi:uroporphyrinogen III methyltransferase/synthase|nr:uroporphyrinogen-III C-methyltransferase [Acidimicrobiales bacterium]
MTVFLVGAGPGDPGLLTVRAAEVIARADVVVYDRLSAAALLDLAPADAERISVGKAPGRAEMSQDDINALLVERGRAGQHVVRLKGGDPFVFARGGEEAAALLAADIDFVVVPGITSAIAVPAYAGIPVTLRHSSTSVTLVTGHEDPDVGDEGTVDWDAVARVGGTIVVLMGVARIGQIASRLMAGGRRADTPVASITWGTRPEQRTVRATLGTIAQHRLESPATIVIGEVAAQDLSWFEKRPLFGKSVVVTRARVQSSTLKARLLALGASVVEVPVIVIDDPDDGGAALRHAASEVTSYDWVVLTSVNGAERFLSCLRDARDLAGVQVAAIGPGTAEALAARNIKADLVPTRFVAETLLAEFPSVPANGGRVLLPRAAAARDVLPRGLRERGWSVDVVDAYRTRSATPSAAAMETAAAADVITFTSSSTVERYLELGVAVPPVVACIGPVTAAAARARGLKVSVEAAVHSIDGLVDALVANVEGR